MNANRTEFACGSKESDPLFPFPQGKAGAGMVPPTPRTMIASKKRWQSSLPPLPPQEGFQNAPLKSPLRDPPVLSPWVTSNHGVRLETKK